MGEALMAWWGAVAQAAMEVGKEWMNSSSQHKANRTNIRMAREQRDWSEEMSNTAVQRRRADIEAAGGNPALAFTNGQEASSPVLSPATVNPPQIGAVPNITSKQLAVANIKNIDADTLDKLATARSKKVQADIDEASANAKRESTVNKHVEEYEQQDLKTQIMRNLSASSAAEAKRNTETVEAMIARAKQDAEKGELDLAALRNIASVGGIEASKMKDILKLIIDLWKD